MKSSRLRRPLLAICVLAAASVLAAAPLAAAAATYQGPSAVLASKDGKSLFVANADARQIAIVDVAAARVTRSVTVPAEPSGMALSPDGNTLYVTCAAPKSTVCLIDVASGQVSGQIPAGHSAWGVAVTPDGKRLYVCNRYNNEVVVIDVAAKKEVAKVPMIREPVGATIAAEGKLVYVINLLPIDRADAYDVAASVAAIDTATNQAVNLRLPNGSSSVRGICASPDGKYVYVAHILARYQMPTTQLERGWMNTNAMTIIDAAEKKIVNTVLLDDVDLGAANPYGVATTADGKTICVSHAGTQELSVIDATALMEKLAKVAPAPAEKPAEKAAEKPAEKAAEKPADKKGEKKPAEDRGLYATNSAAEVPNDLAFLVGLRKRIKLPGNGAHGVAVIGTKVYVAEYFTDTVAVVDLEAKPYQPVTQIALGPKPEMTVQRRGEMLFNSGEICFQHWQSCESCHPDARVDALNWDLMNDGLGNPKNTKSMLLAHKTPPAMSLGVRMTAEQAVRAGLTHILFCVRPEEEAVAIDEYLKSLTPLPSPFLVDGKLSAAAERGKKIFDDQQVGCARCHPAPLFTDLQTHDVASKGQYDRDATAFDCPTLVECWRTAPYLHDGQWLTIKDLIVKGKHGAKGGDISKLTPQQIDDLVEYVLSL